jgi:glutamine amidotransferase-like uncharacterized protein
VDIKNHLKAMAIPYDAVTSIVSTDFSQYAALIVPGGNSLTEYNSLGSARTKIGDAIKDGLGYLGHCAGAFLTGDYGSWGLKLVPKAIDYPSFYYSGTELAMSKHSLASGEVRYILYYGGPDLSGLGETIATYRNGATSIVQLRVGKGLMVLTGGHPESSQATIQSLGLTDPDGDDAALEHKLIDAVVSSQEVK